ncbi:uncharacterized protein N7469_003749 [Penicillium citrinum]|uniref:Phospholipid metabolism enzyme regulator n=2 Tax=Penicillium TaxID=5073 RepID=A0A9W9P3E5_PENCI|nr:uncharacterized protein N7469_003749 [Penicillium citrinum]KAJ5234581.1 hypothetical protein N7469_003749 [Penicillium citrinum]KAJ5590202.1 hypothetical protein N7450_004174 [Penicillium hetheringtonii]
MAAESERPPCLNGASGQSGGPKNTEAASEPAHRSVSESDAKEASRPTIKSQTQAMFQPPKLSPSPSNTSVSPSAPNSAVSSRESSPVRFSSRTANSTSTSRIHSRSRKGSQERSSPSRSTNGVPSALPIPSSTSTQRAQALSNNAPFLSPPPAPEPPANVLSPEKSNMPSWAGNRRTDLESTPSNTSHKRASLPASEDQAKVDRNNARTVTRGVSGQGSSLETVQEMASNPSTPSSDTATKPATPDDSRLHTIDEDPTPRAAKQNAESGSDSGGNRSSDTKEEARPNVGGNPKPAGTIMPKRSTTSLSAGARGKPADGSVRNMIVETETVPSIPQVSLGVGAGERGNAGRAEPGTLRMKPSTETIRPRKEKKKTRRPNALTTGPASSKADIFEAKVASAVDEADVSDSDETFVYESNPPDPFPARQSRYHSRTPSATSMASQVDQLAGRARGMRDGSHSVTGKRSMKFTNNQNPFNPSLDGEMAEQDGSRNSSRVDGNGAVTPRHHNIGRHGRNGVLPSLFDNDSTLQPPQSQLKSPRHFIGSGYRHSRNNNTRSSPNYKTMGGSRKSNEMFDFDAEGADDERTPLVGTPRAPRSRGHGGSRRPNSASLRQMEYLRRQRGCVTRYGSCAMIIFLLMIIAGGATTFVLSATKTLQDVRVLAIQNVLASEQEIMLDLNVQAVNPNIFPVTIDDTDVNIFARSRYVGTDKLWRDHGTDGDLDHFPRVKESQRRWQLSQIVRCLGNMDCVREAQSRQSSTPRIQDGVDHGTDPITDPEGDQQTMLLGRVFRFDSPLSFDASPWENRPSTSKGQIRLPRPGNKTEEGGTERWERVLQHPFELIVRGVVKYQLPLSSRYYSAPISSSVKVVPDKDGDGNGDDPPNTTPPSNETAHVSFTKRGPTSVRLLDTNAYPEQRSGFFKRQFTS